MRKELGERNYSDIPTGKLVELIAKISSQLANDEEQIIFTGAGTKLGGFTHHSNG